LVIELAKASTSDSKKKETDEVKRRRSDRSLGKVLPEARRGRAARAVRIMSESMNTGSNSSSSSSSETED
jgi:hypothetical protein